MIEYEVVKLMWKSSKKDLIPTFATFILCLVIGVEYGIVAGVGINLMFLLYPSVRPQVNVEICFVSFIIDLRNFYFNLCFNNGFYFLIRLKLELSICW